jgi:hypothetical protein
LHPLKSNQRFFWQQWQVAPRQLSQKISLRAIIQRRFKISDDDRKNIDTAIEAVEESMKGDDKDQIEAAVQKLTEAAQVIYQQATAEAEAAQQAASGDGAASDDDVVDAEFEEVDQDEDNEK